jgi:hypothetical protein
MIGLVSCSSKKLGRAAPARELYTSPMFRIALAYAERRCAAVYVLSALHGLVELDTVLEPYDLRINTLSADERTSWGAGVIVELESRHPAGSVEILAGRAYVDALAWRTGWSATEPLRGMKIGERLRWLSMQNKAAA